MKALSQRQIFVFAKVDLPTFLTLTDDDLKELGIAAFGARRKMLLTIQGELLVLSLSSLVATLARRYVPDLRF